MNGERTLTVSTPDLAIASRASRSIKEASKFCEVGIAASSKDKDYSYFPSQESWQIDKTANYIHITPNEAIGGVAMRSFNDTTIPLVADFSSSILSTKVVYIA